MDDSEVVAAIAGGDPAGLAAAYDKYAAALYGYCRWMLPDSGHAASALLATFVTAATLDGLKDTGQLRAFLYAAARSACYRQMRTAGAGFDEVAGEAKCPAGQAEMRRLVRATLADLKHGEHEVIELSLRHNLDVGELATVLEVSWSRAHVLAERARDHLEKALGALLIANTERQFCPELGASLAGWDGWLTVQIGKLTAQHIEHCGRCAQRRSGALRLEVLSRVLPLAALPGGLREPILQRASADLEMRRVGTGPARRSRPRRTTRARSAWLAGFQRIGLFLRWSTIRANPGSVTAVAAVTVWIVAAISAMLITVTGTRTAHTLATQTHVGAAAPTRPRTHPSSLATAAEAAVVKPVSVSVYNPLGQPGDDDPAEAQDALGGGTGWHTSYYFTPGFGNLKKGTGLILDLGRQVRLSQVAVQFGAACCTHVTIEIGNSSQVSQATLDTFAVVQGSATAAGSTTFKVTSAAASRYLLIWITSLPQMLDNPGRFETLIYDVAVRGYPTGQPG